MSTQRGNVRKSGPPKYQNKSAFKNVYHDTSKQTQKIVNLAVTGVCARCKDVIDWKIKYKKYKPLTQPKTCATCKQKTIRQAYHVYCLPCSEKKNVCAKCGDKKDIVLKPEKSAAEAASEDRELQFELEQLPERKRRTFLRLQEKGMLPSGNDDDDDYDVDEIESSDVDNDDDEIHNDFGVNNNNEDRKENSGDKLKAQTDSDGSKQYVTECQMNKSGNIESELNVQELTIKDCNKCGTGNVQ